MVGLWLSLILAYAGLMAVLGGPFLGALPFAAFMASLTVATTLLLRLVFSCSTERALVGAVAALGALHVALSLVSARGGNFNARIDDTATWIDGKPTAAGAMGFVYVLAGMALATLVAYVIQWASRRVLSRLIGRASDD